jgi:hypothetical protein
VAAPEGIDSGEEELPQLVQRCARRTGGCDNLGMALSAHRSIDLPGTPVRGGRWKWPATKMGVGGNAYYMRITEGPLLARGGSRPSVCSSEEQQTFQERKGSAENDPNRTIARAAFHNAPFCENGLMARLTNPVPMGYVKASAQ